MGIMKIHADQMCPKCWEEEEEEEETAYHFLGRCSVMMMAETAQQTTPEYSDQEDHGGKRTRHGW